MLFARLKEAFIKEAPVHLDSTTTTSNKPSITNKTTRVYIIAEDSWWKFLKTSMKAEEPTNPTFKLPRAPTVAEEEAKYVPHNFDFKEKFDRPVCEGRVKKKL